MALINIKQCAIDKTLVKRTDLLETIQADGFFKSRHNSNTYHNVKFADISHEEWCIKDTEAFHIPGGSAYRDMTILLIKESEEEFILLKRKVTTLLDTKVVPFGSETSEVIQRLIALIDTHEARWNCLIENSNLELTPCVSPGWVLWHENSREIMGSGKTPQEAVDNALKEKESDHR